MHFSASCAETEREPAMAAVDSRIESGPSIRFVYTNWRGETAPRRARLLGLRRGSTEWHPRPQWLLRAVDLDKNAEREFAVADIVGLRGLQQAVEQAAMAAAPEHRAAAGLAAACPVLTAFLGGAQDPIPDQRGAVAAFMALIERDLERLLTAPPPAPSA